MLKLNLKVGWRMEITSKLWIYSNWIFKRVQINDSKNGNCFLILQSISIAFISLAGTVICIFTKPGDGNRNFFHWAIVSKAMTISFIIHPDFAGPCVKYFVLSLTACLQIRHTWQLSSILSPYRKTSVVNSHDIFFF